MYYKIDKRQNVADYTYFRQDITGNSNILYLLTLTTSLFLHIRKKDLTNESIGYILSPDQRRVDYQLNFILILQGVCMTVCIAMLFEDSKGVVVASDRLTTSSRPPMEFEHKKRKIKKINDRCVVLSAGDALIPNEIIGDSSAMLSQHTSPTIEMACDVIKDKFVSVRRRVAEELFLKPRGVTFKEFYDERIRTWPEGMVQALDKTIRDNDLEVEFIVAGIDREAAHIYIVFDPGTSMCFDNLGYTVVGIGEFYALSVITREYDPQIKEEEALKLIYKAKKSSEFAPGVGETTDITILKDGHFKDLTEDEINKLDKGKV